LLNGLINTKNESRTNHQLQDLVGVFIVDSLRSSIHNIFWKCMGGGYFYWVV